MFVEQIRLDIDHPPTLSLVSYEVADQLFKLNFYIFVEEADKFYNVLQSLFQKLSGNSFDDIELV